MSALFCHPSFSSSLAPTGPSGLTWLRRALLGHTAALREAWAAALGLAAALAGAPAGRVGGGGGSRLAAAGAHLYAILFAEGDDMQRMVGGNGRCRTGLGGVAKLQEFSASVACVCKRTGVLQDRRTSVVG